MRGGVPVTEGQPVDAGQSLNQAISLIEFGPREAETKSPVNWITKEHRNSGTPVAFAI